MSKLFHNTVTPLLAKVLKELMRSKQFREFRLVGGTALSLQIGHRESIDIDLFTDAKYDSIDFDAINKFLKKKYKYIDSTNYKEVGMGNSYFVGETKTHCIKLDVFYTDKFIQPITLIDNLRFASIEEIIAMKVDVIARGGRKKDFWDIHEFVGNYSFEKMMNLHKQRYPYSHHKKEIKNNFTKFTNADEDFNPVCLKGKYWEVIKLDIIDFVK